MLEESTHNSTAIRTAWPPLSHPFPDQPETSTVISHVKLHRTSDYSMDHYTLLERPRGQ